VEYEPLAGVFSPEAALEPEAPRVHPDHDKSPLAVGPSSAADVDAALAASAFVETRTFTTQRIEHAFLEPEACFGGSWGLGLGASGWVEGRRDCPSPLTSAPSPIVHGLLPRPGRLRPIAVRLRRSLASTRTPVKVTLVSNGGAFGGKEDLSIQGQTALMALATGRPVKAR